MRIKCNSVRDFLANLEDQQVYRKIIYVDRSQVPMGVESLRDATSMEVYIQASAVLEYVEEENVPIPVNNKVVGEALLECGELCGVDRRTADGDNEGTRKQDKLYNRLCDYCAEHGLTLKPGLLDM